MSSTNLTRAEAAARSALIRDVHYVIDLDLTAGGTPGQRTFPSMTTLSFTADTHGETFLDLRADAVTAVILDGTDITAEAVPLSDGAYDEDRGLQLVLTEGSHDLTVMADAVYSSTGEGLHRFTDPADGATYMYTQFEAADAKRVFACFDQPDIKATYEVSVKTPENWTVVTNNVVGISGELGVEVDGVAVHTAVVDYPLSTYLIAFCVGPWAHVTDEWTGRPLPTPETEGVTDTRLVPETDITVPLGIYVRQSLADYLDADVIFEVTKAGFDYYAANFGVAYPFHKYDQIFCPEYNMGAMENAGCVTIRDEYVFRSAASHYEYERRADTILHELAHMWFGDLVTMQWWDDLWLNESFATWSSAMAQTHATEHTTAWVTFNSKEKSWAYGQDQLPSTHPVFSGANDLVEVDANFDGITYAKGASVLKQLAAYVGLEPFFAGIRAHFVNHAFANATFDDLLGALEKASGRDLSDWADQWLKTTGINTLGASFTTEGEGGPEAVYTSFAVTQTGAQPGAGDTRTHRLAIGLYDLVGELDDAGSTPSVELRRRVELDVNGSRTEVPELVGDQPADLVIVNDDDLAYGFVDLDADSLAFAVANIARISDPMARVLIWSAAWQATRNAQMQARDFVTLVARGAAAEDQLGVLEQILGQAIAAVERYVADDWKEEGRRVLIEAFRSGAETTDGQARLAFVRAYTNAAQTVKSTDWLRGLLGLDDDTTADDLLPGFAVDQDMRWRLLTALVGTDGALSTEDAEELIAIEEGADRTSSGAGHALQARTAVPTSSVKQAAWDVLTLHGADESNLALRFRMGGFTHVGQDDLLAPFGAGYVNRVVEMWNSLSSEMALRNCEGLFPSWSDDTVLADIRALADAESTPAGLRRVLSEGVSRAERAAAARAFDAQ
ncbi:aminopeptidase N [Corynebacterium terpenotabidum]|uniref:Aminopeptidase N n=1 Tax=Corynebacterium terpenotabidum Y-11 TaxID=1200352 RepID=S4XCM0_9CORY|nr:aminopeptidase N [Corynebacterium terpenotabidum]AGP30341.1 Aminopeptidase N [Corynebacterium terpenotabidum Y-11]